VLTGAEVVAHTGFVGNFATTIKTRDGEETVRHGVAVIATGGVGYRPTEYLFGEHPAVVTQREFQRRLVTDPQARELRRVVMIQCVGSREEAHPYCSRTCCQEAVRNCLSLKALNPEAEVFVLYRDMRTYGLSEIFYRQAREAGVLFLRYDQDAPPEVSEGEGGGLLVRLREPGLGEEIEISPDLLVLSAGLRPHPGAEPLARAMRLPRDADGFFLEAHAKLRPLDFATAGVFLCGLAHGPKTIEESLTQARGAAARAATILAKEEMLVGGAVAQVDPERCTACLTCVRTCPFGVPALSEESGVVEIDAAACQGCGNCAAACPRGAISVGHYRDAQMEAKIAAVSSA
jgi:heterodisulfide reductase subunit A-like polyferredoxin